MGEERRVSDAVFRDSTRPAAQNADPSLAAEARKEPHALYMVSVAFLIFAGISLIMALPPFWRQYRVLSWPEIKVQVIRSDVVQLTYAGHSYYTWDLQLLFTRDGQPHVGSVAPRQSRDYQQVRHASDQYPVGSYHNVRVNPKNLEEIRLHAGWNWQFFAISILLGSAAAAFGLIALALFLFARSRSAEST